MSRREQTDADIVAGYRAVNRVMDSAALPALVECGITMAQLKALMAVTAAGSAGIAVTALGAGLSIGQPSASLLADQLVKAGLATRTTDSADRRRVLVTASARGEELADDLRLGRRATLAEWLAHVSDEDAEALARGLAALASAAGDARRAE